MNSGQASTKLTIGFAGPVDLDRLGRRIGEPRLSQGLKSPILTDIVESLADRGHRIQIFTLSPNPEDVGEYGDETFGINVGAYRSGRRWPDFFRAERRALTRAMRAHPCDVIHAHWTYEFAIAAMRARTAPVLVTVHDWGPEILRRQRHPYRLVRLLMQAYVLVRAPHLTANSPYIAEKVRRWYRRTVAVVPNGIAVPDRLSERSGTEGLIVGSVNNGFGKLKNVQRLIDAFALIKQERPGASLQLVGADFQPGGPAFAYARQQEALEGIDFVGPLPAAEIPVFMRSIDVLVHPSLEESFGMTLVEAIVEGALVVGGCDSGAVPWVLGEGVAGTLADVRDPEQIACAVLALPDDHGSRQMLRQRAFAHVADNFSLDHVIGQYEAILRGAIQ
jgi:L-malate glycosyltransferase